MYVAIDIGGTRCRILITRNLVSGEDFDRHEFLLSHMFEEDMASLISSIRRFTANHDITAISLGVPGDLNKDKTAFVDPSDNLTEWGGKPIKIILGQEFCCPVYMDNDGIAAALGEAYYGLGKDRDFAFVIWGTGVGGAKIEIVDGKIACRALDWYRYFESWENACGGNRLRQRFGKEGSRLTEGEWSVVMADFENELTKFIQLTSVSHVIFGGGVSIRQSARLQALSDHFSNITIQVSGLGEDAGLYGALAIIRNHELTAQNLVNA